MSDIPELVAAIDRRLTDIAGEISALDAAKAELAAPRTGGQAPGHHDAASTRPRRRTARRVTPSPTPPEPATGSRAPDQVKAAPESARTVTPRRSTQGRAASRTRRRAAGGAVRAETLERLLAGTSVGLSANAIAKQADAGYSRTLRLLHELEAAGQVRRSGSRRSTVWQLITDEERIAQRAAELERLRRGPGQRRGRARAWSPRPSRTSTRRHEYRRGGPIALRLACLVYTRRTRDRPGPSR